MATRKSNYRKRRTNPKHDKNYTKGKDSEVMNKKEGNNDPRWWGDKPYVDAVGRFNFSNALGMPIPWTFRNVEGSDAVISLASENYVTNTIPGVMAIDVLPTFGQADAPVDPANTYLRSFYSKLRSTNNQNAPYQAPDLGMYLFAVDSIHMGIEQLKRMYGIARTYAPMNRYLPNAYLSAMGIDPTATSYNLYGNLANFRAAILALMMRVQTLAMPTGININERHRELVKYVYADSNTAKTQAYLFRTPYLYKYRSAYNESGGGLVADPMPAQGSNAMAWVSWINSLIDQVAGDEDFAIISGDIIKSFGYDALYRMEFLDEDYMIAPMFNPEILLQIHNAKVVGDRYASNSFDIYQTAFDNCFHATTVHGTNGPTAGPICPIIDVPVDFPDSDTVMVATRLAVVGTYGYIDNLYKFVPDSCGTELVIRVTIYYNDSRGLTATSSSDTNVVSGTTHGSIALIGKQSFFDWHPIQYEISGNNTTGAMALYGIFSDLSDYTVVEPGALSRLHQTAVYGSLTVRGLDTVGLHK